MSEVDGDQPRQGLAKDLDEESEVPPPYTAQRRQRAALARYVEKIKRRAEARAEAPKVSKEHGPDIEPATGTWSD